jgi:hypothetical protein
MAVEGGVEETPDDRNGGADHKAREQNLSTTIPVQNASELRIITNKQA